ncbi:hypothetical protein C8Q74DRAFT_1282538 [Fomes fomentarius]|nr:hypothetical protein C8Q74DRAFT_1282538 [Fomes fomentarius]
MNPSKSCTHGQQGGGTHPCDTSTTTADTSSAGTSTSTTTATSGTSSTSNAGSSSMIQITSTTSVSSTIPPSTQTSTGMSSLPDPRSSSSPPPESPNSVPNKPSLNSTSATGDVSSGYSSPSTNWPGLNAPTSVFATNISVLPTGWNTVTVTAGTVPTTVYNNQTVFVYVPYSTSTPASRGNEHRDTTLGLAIGIPLLLLLVAGAISVFFVRRRRRRELNGAPSRPFTFAPIRYTDSHEVLPAYSPPVELDKEYHLFPEKFGALALPPYGYTIHEPQVEWESEQEGTSGEGGRLMHGVHADPRSALVPLRRSE